MAMAARVTDITHTGMLTPSAILIGVDIECEADSAAAELVGTPPDDRVWDWEILDCEAAPDVAARLERLRLVGDGVEDVMEVT